MTKASDHDLLIVLNTKMDLLTATVSDHCLLDTRRFDKMEQEKLDLSKAEVLFNEKADLLVREKADSLVRESNALHVDYEKRLRRLEWSLGIATGVILAFQFFMAYWKGV